MTTGIKDAARDLLNRLPDDVTWDELMRAIYERIVVEQGLEDIRAGRTTSNEDVRRQFGLTG